METLLTKIEVLEREAQERIEQAEAENKTRVEQLVAGETSALKDVQHRAVQRAQQITKEQHRLTDEALGMMKQEHQQTVDLIHTTAERNRADALELGLQLFRTTYLSE